MHTHRAFGASVARAPFRAATLALLVILLAACAEDDTIVAVTIASSADVGLVPNLRVSIAQGARVFDGNIVPPTESTDAGVHIKPSFFERVALPDDWENAPATITVLAENTAGAMFSSTAMATIRPGGAVAANVMLGMDPPPSTSDAGVADDDAGGADAAVAP